MITAKSIRDKKFAFIISELRSAARVFQMNHSDVCDVILFGSYSTGQWDALSDIDLALILPDGVDLTEQARNEFYLATGKEIDLIVLSDDWMLNNRSMVANELRLYGKSLIH